MENWYLGERLSEEVSGGRVGTGGPSRTLAHTQDSLGEVGRPLLGNVTLGGCARPERAQREAVAMVSLPDCALRLLCLSRGPVGSLN